MIFACIPRFLGIFQSIYTDLEDKIEIFPCGIAGGSCVSAISYLHEQVAFFRPDTVVIMLGMNDIWRENYLGEITKQKLFFQKVFLFQESVLDILQFLIK